MNSSITAWFETGFNITYLAAVWIVVILMIRRMGTVEPANLRVARLLRLAFILLASGDTATSGRVGGPTAGHCECAGDPCGFAMN